MGIKIPGGFKGLLAATAIAGAALVGVACGDDDGGSSTSSSGGSTIDASSSTSSSGSSSGSTSGGTDAGEDAAPATFTVGGTVTGLAGATGLVLQLNGANNLTITADGAFVFTTPRLTNGAAYSVTIATQPTGKTCSVSAGNGTIAGANATGVVVNCATNAFTVGGTISGLATGASVSLTLNGGTALVRNANGAYAFTTAIAQGGQYTVAVSVQPTNPTQVCTVANATGTMGGANVTNVNVTCVTSTFTVGGTISGLASGATVVLQNNLGGNLSRTANGTYNFPAQASGTAYSVTVLTQPTSPTQVCTVANPSGTVGAANVTNVNITCTTTAFKVGGSLTGLGGGKTIVLQNNLGDNLSLTADGNFQFATSVASGGAYAVTILTQPAGQVCNVSAGSGTVGAGNVTSVVVNCGNTFTVGGNVTGLAGGANVILRNNNTESVQVTNNGSFAFPTPLADAAAYSVTVQTQPSNPTQTCVVTNGSGNIAGANVTNVSVACTTNQYKVGGTITGLAPSETTTVQINVGAGETFQIVANGNWVFPTSVNSGTAYDVNVTVQPTGAIYQTCTVQNAAGVVGAGDVTNVAIQCSANSYFVGGNVSGLASGTTLTLQNNLGDNEVITNNGAFTFDTKIASGSDWSATVLSQTGIPNQTCLVTGGGSGTVTNADITAITVVCTTNSYKVGGNLVGMDTSNENTVTLLNNMGDEITLDTNGAFQFPTALLSGTTYAVTVKAGGQPTSPAQTCQVSAGTGTVGAGDVTNVVVNCATNSYVIGGTVTGLAAGNTVVLQNNGGDDLNVSTANFAFLTPIASGQTYAVTVLTSPTAPTSQTCVVTGGGSGTVANTNITTVAITCTTNTFTVSGSVVGLETGTQVVLRNNGADDETVLAATPTFTFDTPVASSQNYQVTVQTNPSAPYQQTCVVTSGGNGTIGNANVTGVVITCTTTEYTVSATLSGLQTGFGSVAIQNNANAGDQINMTSNGTFPFTVKVKNGYPFAVAIVAQPNVQQQICKVNDGAGNMPTANKEVKIYCGWTCQSIHNAEPTFPSGNYTVDVDGEGPIAQHQAYCDMDFSGGGWTLVLSTAGVLGPSELAADIVTPGSNKYMPINNAAGIARLSSQVHVRTAAVTPVDYVTSVADAIPIQNLRLAKILNFGIAPVGPPGAVNATARAQWTVAGGIAASRLDFGPCAPPGTAYPNIYWACDNGNGWHLANAETRWGFDVAEVPMEVYVK